jgi:hypothetical protein
MGIALIALALRVSRTGGFASLTSCFLANADETFFASLNHRRLPLAGRPAGRDQWVFREAQRQTQTPILTASSRR